VSRFSTSFNHTHHQSISLGRRGSREFKTAHIRPLLKKPGLDVEILKNYRPVSNSCFLSKLLEKVVASRIDEHIDKHKLREIYQSAYTKLHSTSTALIKVQTDLLQAFDQKKLAVQVLLDLSAALIPLTSIRCFNGSKQCMHHRHCVTARIVKLSRKVGLCVQD